MWFLIAAVVLVALGAVWLVITLSWPDNLEVSRPRSMSHDWPILCFEVAVLMVLIWWLSPNA